METMNRHLTFMYEFYVQIVYLHYNNIVRSRVVISNAYCFSEEFVLLDVVM